MSFSKSEESYIEHEVQLRLHSEQFKLFENSLKSRDHRLNAGFKYLDNKFMLMFGIILGSIWLPAILHYLHIT